MTREAVVRGTVGGEVSLASADLKSRLKFARKNAALTQLDLATHLGITPQSVSSWERGEATPETDKIREICAFLSIDVGWLLGLGTLHAPAIETSQPNTQTDPNIGNAYLYIDEWFERRGVNDEKVANRIGVTRSAVFKWRKEQDRLSPEKMAQLAAALDIQPAELWRSPSVGPSLDAMVAGLPPETQAMIADVVKRMARK